MKLKLNAIGIALLLLLCPYWTFSQGYYCGNDTLSRYDSGYQTYRSLHLSLIQSFKKLNPNYQFLPGGLPQDSGSSIAQFHYEQGCRKTQFIIPVVVHVLHNGESIGSGANISEAQIKNQIDILNYELANAANTGGLAINTGIQLVMATKKPDGSSFNGITRKTSSYATHRFPMDAIPVMQEDVFNPAEYLNIWIVDKILNNSNIDDGKLGYGPFPWYKNIMGIGFVMRYRHFGDFLSCSGCNVDSTSRGKAPVHELGHVLGLFHTFEGGCVGTNINTCDEEGDFCCDIPANTTIYAACSTATNSCTDTPDSPDAIRNYMNYNHQSCYNQFTPEQGKIMHTSLYSYYDYLWHPDNLNRKGITACILSASFGADKISICDSGKFMFTAIDYDTATYKWKIYRGNSLKNSRTDTSHLFEYNFTDTGSYTIILTVVSDGDSITFSRNNYITVRSCAAITPSTQANWYFGERGGLKFSTGGAKADISADTTTVTPQLRGEYSSISQSNGYGNLLFYGAAGAEGRYRLHIYNRNHAQLQNGFPLLADGQTRNGVLVVPHPTDGKKYYILTSGYQGDTAGFRYSIIDTTLNGGLGGVMTTEKNKPVKVPLTGGHFRSALDSAIQTSDGITAIPMCGSGYWIITTDSRNRTQTNKTRVLIYKLDGNGIQFHDSSFFYIWSHNSVVKASPDGNWLYCGSNILKFDRLIGIVGHVDVLGINTGVSFSPDSRFLYTANQNLNPAPLVQHDLYAKEVYKSAKQIGLLTGSKNVNFQLGPDNKIYIAQNGLNYIGVIEKPNEKSTSLNPNACSYTTNGPSLKVNGVGGSSTHGLPNLIDARPSNQILENFAYRNIGCDSVYFYSNTGCATTFFWEFGDGTWSAERNPRHKYNAPGLYTVEFTVNGTTQIKKIQVGIVLPAVAGDTTICDTSLTYVYSVSPYENYTYNWQISGGTPSTIQNSEIAYIHWFNTASNLRVYITDPSSGCTDTLDRTIQAANPVSNNTVQSTQSVCNNDLPANLAGTSPSGGVGSYKYQWWVSTDSLNWMLLTGETDDTLRPAKHTVKKYYYRTVNSGNCYNNSNIISIMPSINGNTISQDSVPCIKGGFYSMSGNVPATGITYRWQTSTNGTSWTNGVTTQNMSGTLNQDSSYVRRIVTKGTCKDTTAAFKVRPRIWISKQLKNIYVCAGSNYTTSIEVANPYSYSLSYSWRYYDSSLSQWVVDLLNNSPNYTNGGSATVGAKYPLNCIVTASCGTRYSDTAIVTIIDSIAITTHPTSTVAKNEGENAMLRVVTSIPGGVLSYQWQYSTNNGGSWLNIADSDNDTLFLNNVSACQDGWKYRAKVNYYCNGRTATSNASTLYVSTDYDLWMKDHTTDTAQQPSTDLNIWHSPDLWLRKSTIGTTPEDYPTYYPGATALVHVRVRNKGTHASREGKLYLYWSKASTGEHWPKNWTTNVQNRVLNNCNPLLSGQLIPLGGEINTSPIDIAPLGVGQERIYTVNWEFPNPSWYCYDSVGQHFMERESMICLLARIQTCDLDSFGMYRREKDSLKYNVIWNNNIVTTNLTIVNLFGFYKKGPTRWTMVTNQPGVTTPIKLKLIPDNFAYFNNNKRVYIQLDDVLKTAWINGGALGSGFTLLPDGRFRVSSVNEFVLQNIVLNENEIGRIGVQFDLDSASSLNFEDWNFSLFHYQNSPTIPDGGVYFNLKYEPISDMVKPESNSNKIGKVDELKEEEIVYVDLAELNRVTTDALIKVYPNPASREIIVSGKQLRTSFVYDLNGKVLMRRDCNKDGNILFDVSTLSDGMVLIESFRNDGTVYREKIVIVH